MIKHTLLFILLSSVCWAVDDSVQEWAAYDGFEYRSRLLDGADGGRGAWLGYWRPSAEGGVRIETASLDAPFFEVPSQMLRYASIEGQKTAGVYRDLIPLQVEVGGSATLWVSFQARVAGAPFDSSGDEASIHFRGPDNSELFSIGVMGRLNEWRVRFNRESTKHFSKGASEHLPEEAAWVIARIDVNLATGEEDSITLWTNPLADVMPSSSSASIVMDFGDIWHAEAPFTLSRIRAVSYTHLRAHET